MKRLARQCESAARSRPQRHHLNDGPNESATREVRSDLRDARRRRLGPKPIRSQGSTATPPVHSRTIGLLGGAMCDAVISINRNYESYLGYFDPSTAGSGIDVNAAASVAAYTVLTSIYTDQYGAGNGYLSNFTTMYNNQLSSIQDG